MTRILVGECKQEVSTFNPVPSSYEDFIVVSGAALLDRPRDGQCELDGALEVFGAQPDIEISPTFSAKSITSGGVLGRADFERIEQGFVEALRSAPPADALYLSLHGAMSAQGYTDPEGHLLGRAREILGEDIPIVVSMDLHGILTDDILRHADSVSLYHTYPHVDMASTGARAARVLLKILAGTARPVTASVRVPALARGDEMITETGLIRHVIRRCREIEAMPGGLSAGMFWGNPFTDVPNLRSNSVVVFDGDSSRASGLALEVADLFWEHHERMFQPLSTLESAVARTLASPGGTTILVDAADAPSSGASGDGVTLVAALLGAGYGGRVLAPVVDVPAVEAAIRAGVGAVINVTVGGTLDRGRFTPLPIQAKVRVISDGHYRGEAWGGSYAGPTAVLESEHATFVVTSRPVSLHDRGLFWSVGQEPRRFDAVVVKCPHCEPQMYKAWCSQLINVDIPGSTSANLKSLGHTLCERPIFPLDTDVTYERRVSLFQRPRYR